MQSGENDDEKLGHDPLEWLAEEVSEDSEDPQPLEHQAEAPTVEETQAEPEEATPDVYAQEDVASEEDESVAAESANDGVFSLPEKLTAQHIEALHSSLKQQLSGLKAGEVFTVDASELSDFDSSGYQLLVSLVKSCEQQEQKCEITNVSDSVQQLLTTIGDQTLAGNVIGG